MIKLSRMADYAVVIMSSIDMDGKEVLSAQQIAKNSNISEATTSKILKSLNNAGLVESVRGLNGGYRLSVSPDKISVEQIISAVDGPIALTECLDTNHDNCFIESFCPTRVGWNKVNLAIKGALEKISLAEIRNNNFN